MNPLFGYGYHGHHSSQEEIDARNQHDAVEAPPWWFVLLLFGTLVVAFVWLVWRDDRIDKGAK